MIIVIGNIIYNLNAIKIKYLKFFGIIYTKALFAKYKIKNGKDLVSNGFPIIHNSKEGVILIGENFSMNNGNQFNQIGRNQPCYLITYNKGRIQIGNNVGISSSSIVSFKSITIGNNVKIGGGTAIYDSDFHSLNSIERSAVPEDRRNIVAKAVIIEDNAFIGAHSMILKGVRIGVNSIVGAGSVVRTEIPDNEIWAGNPAVFIKKIGQI